MRVLLDESLPRDLARELHGHEVDTVPAIGWAGLKNGELLERASGRYNVFLTVDANLPYQQTLSRFAMGVVIVRAKTNRIDDLRPHVPAILTAIADVAPGELRWVGA